jgi:hypothetical protein
VAEPSIKGSVFKGGITDLRRLLDEGRVTEDEIGARLGAESLAYLEGEILDSGWYPLECYARLLQLLGDVEGAGEEKYFIERGRASARRLMDAGLYGQLDFLTRWKESLLEDDRDESMLITRYVSSLKLVVSLSSNIYNVGRWTVETDRSNSGRVWIAIREAGDYSEPMHLVIEGFLNECGSKHTKTSRLYTSSRVPPDLILFRMNYDIVELLDSF